MFPEAAPAAFLRANTRLLQCPTLQRFDFPVIRALQMDDRNQAPQDRNDSLVPTEDLLEALPGLWSDRQRRGTTTTTTGVVSGELGFLGDNVGAPLGVVRVGPDAILKASVRPG